MPKEKQDLYLALNRARTGEKAENTAENMKDLDIQLVAGGMAIIWKGTGSTRTPFGTVFQGSFHPQDPSMPKEEQDRYWAYYKSQTGASSTVGTEAASSSRQEPSKEDDHSPDPAQAPDNGRPAKKTAAEAGGSSPSNVAWVEGQPQVLLADGTRVTFSLTGDDVTHIEVGYPDNPALAAQGRIFAIDLAMPDGAKNRAGRVATGAAVSVLTGGIYGPTLNGDGVVVTLGMNVYGNKTGGGSLRQRNVQRALQVYMPKIEKAVEMASTDPARPSAWTFDMKRLKKALDWGAA